MPPTFYSKMERVLDAKLPGKGLGGQFRTVAERLAAKGEFKREELEWSGLLPWLESQKGAQVRKADVLGFLEANRIEVREVVKGEPPKSPEDHEAEVTRRAEQLADDRDAFARYFPDASDGYFDDVTREDRIHDLEGSDRLVNEVEQYLRGIEGTKFGQYQLPGGENYREILLTLPASVEGWEVRPSQEGVWSLVSPDGQERVYSTREMAENWKERLSAKSRGIRYDSPHWVGQPNVLAHVRFSERTDADGKRVLHVEEVQSDWHQAGRKKGYAFSSLPESWSIEKNKAGKWELRDEKGTVRDVAEYGPDGRELTREEAAARLYRTQNANRVADAPFKTSWPHAGHEADDPLGG